MSSFKMGLRPRRMIVRFDVAQIDGGVEETEPSSPRYVITRPGIGYSLIKIANWKSPGHGSQAGP